MSAVMGWPPSARRSPNGAAPWRAAGAVVYGSIP